MTIDAVKPHLVSETLSSFEAHLRQEERSANTVSKYLRDLRAFFAFLPGQSTTKEKVLEWKEQLTHTHAPASVNSMLAAVNNYLEWVQLPGYRVKPLKIQRAIFTKPEKELTRDEYIRLVQTAEKHKNHRLSLLLQTLCSTGIRVSELSYITVSAVRDGRTTVDLKGKSRTVFLPQELCRSLKSYCREQKIREGLIFCTKKGKPLNRSNIWRDMKALCADAGIQPGKVFPHNLRHLFARTYYTLEKDLSRLADLLGHSNVTTTRIYTMESGTEHIRQLERMDLVFQLE